MEGTDKERARERESAFVCVCKSLGWYVDEEAQWYVERRYI